MIFTITALSAIYKLPHCSEKTVAWIGSVRPTWILPVSIDNDHVNAKCDLTFGERVGLLLSYNETQAVNFDFVPADQSLHQTGLFWRNWLARS